MGTSTNHASPPTPNWNVARALLGRTDVAADRQSQELWRAAVSDRGTRLLESLGSPLLAEAAATAGAQRAPAEAVRVYDAALRASGEAALALDMGRRALARSTAHAAGSSGFAAELFAEAAAYYVARDLPSVVGKEQRIAGPAESIRLKDAIRAVARTTALVAAHEIAPAALTEPGRWRDYVGIVLRALQGGGSAPARPTLSGARPDRPQRGRRR
jgi:hypothetical protein